MIYSRITILLIVIISYLQCTSVMSMERLKRLFNTRSHRKKAAEKKYFSSWSDRMEAAEDEMTTDEAQSWLQQSAAEDRKRIEDWAAWEKSVEDLKTENLLPADRKHMLPGGMESGTFDEWESSARKATAENIKILHDGIRLREEEKAEVEARARLEAKEIRERRARIRSNAQSLYAAEVATAQSKLRNDLELLKSAKQWKLKQAYLQFPAEGSLNVYRVHPHTSESETTDGLLSIDGSTANVAKLTSDSLFTVAQYIPHQLYRLASHEGNGYLCAFSSMKTFTVRKINDVIYRGQNLWCDWMEIKNPQQSYFVPIAGYALYEISDDSSTKKIAFRNSMEYQYADEQTMNILNDKTVYITNKVSHWRAESAWTVKMRSITNLMKDTSFHHAFQRTRFTPEMIASKGVIIDGAAFDVYVFTNTFELKKIIGSNGREGSICLCVTNGKMVALPNMKDSEICQWIKEEPKEGANEVIFSSRAV